MIDSRAGTEPMHLVLNEEDLPYEEEILRNPHSIKPWIRYIGEIGDNNVLYKFILILRYLVIYI